MAKTFKEYLEEIQNKNYNEASYELYRSGDTHGFKITGAEKENLDMDFEDPDNFPDPKKHELELSYEFLKKLQKSHDMSLPRDKKTGGLVDLKDWRIIRKDKGKTLTFKVRQSVGG